MKPTNTIQRVIGKIFLGSMVRSMAHWEQQAATNPHAIKAVNSSPTRFETAIASLELEEEHPPMPGFPKAVPSVLSSFWHIRRSLTSLTHNPDHPQTTITSDRLANLEVYARSLGVGAIGYTKVPREWIFQEKAILHENAIVLVMEMSWERMATAPSMDTALMVHETYDDLGCVANQLADHLRNQGYSAHASHPRMGLVLYPPLAQKAGLGWRGSSGMLITPEFGPRVRLAAVFTNIENLPFAETNEHTWIADYCRVCRRCAKTCPAQAVLEQPVTHENGLTTCTDKTKCFPEFAKNHGCSVCIKSCPFNTTNYDKLKAAHARLSFQK